MAQPREEKAVTTHAREVFSESIIRGAVDDHKPGGIGTHVPVAVLPWMPAAAEIRDIAFEG